MQKETGWLDSYLLWEIPWVTVRMKMADAPYYSYSSKSDSNVKTIESEEELEEFLENIG